MLYRRRTRLSGRASVSESRGRASSRDRVAEQSSQENQIATPWVDWPGAMKRFHMVIEARVRSKGRGRMSSRASSRKPEGRVEIVEVRSGGKGWVG